MDQLPSRPFWSFPMLRFPSILKEGEEDWVGDHCNLSGITIWEDASHVYVEASLPGLNLEEIDISFDRGVLWIKGEKQNVREEKSKKYYCKAATSFSYRVTVPGNLDEHKHPEASYNQGILQVSFYKASQSQPRKIPIKNH